MGIDAYMYKGEAVAFYLENFSPEDQDEFRSIMSEADQKIIHSDCYQGEPFYVAWASKPETLFSWYKANLRRPLVFTGGFERLNCDNVYGERRDDSCRMYSFRLDDLNRLQDEPLCGWEQWGRKWFDNKDYLSHQVVNKLYARLQENEELRGIVAILERNQKHLFPGMWIFYYNS